MQACNKMFDCSIRECIQPQQQTRLCKSQTDLLLLPDQSPVTCSELFPCVSKL